MPKESTTLFLEITGDDFSILLLISMMY